MKRICNNLVLKYALLNQLDRKAESKAVVEKCFGLCSVYWIESEKLLSRRGASLLLAALVIDSVNQTFCYWCDFSILEKNFYLFKWHFSEKKFIIHEEEQHVRRKTRTYPHLLVNSIHKVLLLEVAADNHRLWMKGLSGLEFFRSCFWVLIEKEPACHLINCASEIRQN